MSVLADTDRAIVAAVIARSRIERRRVPLTRTEALAPHPRRPKVEKSEPLLFMGLCSWCGGPALFGSQACEGHSDLIALDGRTSAVVTTNTNGSGRSSLDGISAAGASQETS